MTQTQKLREALQAISHIDDTTNHSVDASAALDRIGQIARQALALPTADHLPDAGEMVNGLTKAETDASASVSGLTGAPVGEREAFEAWLGITPCGAAHDFGWAAWQARAAQAAKAVPNPWRDAVIEQLESWHIYVPAIHENSPRLAIKALVNIETQTALDPKVSRQAAALAAGAVPDERDKVDAQRYRWLADCLNYPEAVTLISDGSLTEEALGKAIDAAMRKDKL